MMLSFNMSPPVFKGSQSPLSIASITPKTPRPVAKMHTKIMENYRFYRMIFENQKQTDI